MNKADAEKEIVNIKKKILEHEKLYFENKETEDSDYQYDCLFKRLNELEILFPELKTTNSPTQYIKTNLTLGFQKYKYDIPMLSLKKTYSLDELNDFFDHIENNFGKVSFCCEPKFDGVSVNLHYKNGSLESISTRGNGHTGDNITRNKNIISNCQEKITNKETIDVRGEALMFFEKFNENADSWSNPRNATSGLLRTLKQNTNEKLISLHVYDLLPHNFPSQDSMLKTLQNLGFQIPNYKFCKTREEIFDYIKNFEQERKKLPFPTDGVVIKLNELNFYDQLGTTNKSPRWAIAFKYKPDSISTKLKSIHYQVGRTGVITPVANFEPVFISGSTVKCASLYNPQEIKRLNLCENDFVLIEKSGEIIPKIIGIDITRRDVKAKPINFISHCPSCQAEVILKNDLCYCTNKNCPEKILNIISHFVSKKAMNINSLGTKTIKLLIENNLIKNFTDLYELTFEKIISLPGFDNVSTNKLIDGIKLSSRRSFEHVLFAIGIGGVGEVVAKNIVQKCKNIETLLALSLDDLIKIPLVGDEIAVNIKNFFAQKENLEMIKRLRGGGLKFEVEGRDDAELDLQNKIFVITGTFIIDREKIKEKIISRGGRVSESVSEKIDYVLVGKNPGAIKISKAKDLKLKIFYNLEYFNLDK
ncbi:MAG: NAD-dependent DNA ligase LigA [Cytophagales bacterium]|jgi:DNA ligase (NAD+)|nr:NAD-dependent DNA ligase LigA [Cytophagales bacterium]